MSGESSIDDLIHELRQRDVRLRVDKDELSVDAPKGVLMQEDVRRLRAHKEQILTFLRDVADHFEPPPLQPWPKADRIPLSFAQQRLWIVDQLSGPQGTARAMRYHLPQALRLHGPLDLDVLQRVLDELVARHEVLRTRIGTVDGVPVQSIAADATFLLHRFDLRAHPADDREAEMYRLLEYGMQEPFDLASGPMIRGFLLRMADDDHVLFIAMHHIASDGWSLQILWREICALYDGFRRGEANPLPAVEIQYADYAQWERSWLQGSVLDAHLDYWKRQLSGVAGLELPRDHALPPVPSFKGATQTFAMPKDVAAGVRALSSSSACSLFMTMFALFHVLLSRLSGQRDFAVVTPVAGRSHRGTESLVGLCVNSLALRVSTEPGISFRRMLAKTKRVVLDAFKHQDLPFEQLIAWIRSERDAALGGVSFTMNSISRGQLQPEGLQVEPVLLPWSTAKSELTLGVHESQDELYGVFEYSCDSFEARTVEQLERRFVRIAQQIVANPDIALDDIDVALEDEPAAVQYRYSARYLDDRAYWLADRCDGEPVSLSTGATRQAEAGYLCAELVLDGKSARALGRASATYKTSLPQLLLAGTALYLHKASGAEPLRFGLATDDGGDALPVEFAIDATVNLREFAQMVSDRCAATLKHGDCGSENIRQLRGGDDGWRCLTVVGVTERGRDTVAMSTGTAAVQGAELRVQIFVDAGVRIELRADGRLFEQWELGAHLDALRALLAQMAAPKAARASVQSTALLSGDARAAMLARCTGERTGAPGDALIHELFEARAKQQPQALAVLHGTVEVSYSELNARANRLANHLRALDVGPGKLVVVCLERSADLIAALLAVLKSGAAYAPVDPATAAERLHYAIADTQAAAIITQSRLVHLLPDTRASVVVVDSDANTIAQRSAAYRRRPAARPASTLAYIIYTSGSTGEPKGVMVEHGNLINHARWMQREFGLSGDDRALQFASISFDASAEEIYPTLLAGAAVVIRQAAVPGAQELVQCIVAQGITLLNLPTAYWHVLVEALAGERVDTGRLRLIIVGGERVSLESLLRWRAIAGDGIEWVNTYGPTEATITSTLYRAPRDCSGLTGVPIGRPIDNADTYVLDRSGQPVPVGVIGELCIGGAGVASGYWRRDDLTAERFVADPFTTFEAARMYRSGDLVRWLPDGNIAYVGRNDDQLKLRGFRIEPGEIEMQLRACPHVREATVLLREDVPGDKRLVAYIGCVRPPATLVADVRERLEKVLPEYMVPSAFVVLDALPMTLNGKLDRRALPAPEANTSDAQAYEEPKGAIEQVLAQIWRDVLHAERVGRHDNFFDLGGSSISAIQVIGRANQAGLKLNLNAIFEDQSIAQLAAFIERTGAASGNLTAKRPRAAMQAPERGSIEGGVPFTPIQIQVLHQGEDAVRYMTASRVLSCRRTLAPDLLEAALRKLIIYHDALRLCITRDESGEWSQAIAPAARVGEYSVLECETVASREGIASVLNAALERAAGRIDSHVGSLLQASLVSVGEDAADGQALVLAAHHFAMDPVSWEILVQDLQTIYDQLEAGMPARLPVKGASFRDWSASITAYANGSEARPELDYWRASSWASRSELPTEVDAADEDAESLCVTVGLDAAQTRALLSDVPRVHGAHVNEVLLAAVARALHRRFDRTQFALGMYHHGRAAAIGNLDLSRTIGWFTAPVPLLLDVEPGATMHPSLSHVKAILRAMPHEGVGYGILRHLRSDADMLPVAEIDVLLNHQGTVAGDAPGGLFTAHFDEREYAELLPKFKLPWKLAILSNIADGCLRANFVSSRYSRQTLQAIADAFEDALRELCDPLRTH
ncbi:non-ribosomal peptide synthetase [Tahibacter sp.]|uniref:non-ribosomal peptide synthetase n=1 Tax=Tahibacter sp. TaxID=2056211 RepID=UPI0028C44DBF|nr:non-ribosomal peptide synthetase [Tahibacter sp.]